jgi:hypothetical protein
VVQRRLQIAHDHQQSERDHITGVLQQCNWKIQGDGHAAGPLGLAPSTLRWKMRKLSIARPVRAGLESIAAVSQLLLPSGLRLQMNRICAGT